MKVVHVCPTPFGVDGLLGGGERYPLELARALARDVDCALVTFGHRVGESREPGGLRIRVLRPLAHLWGHPAHALAPALPHALAGADVVHTHHMRSTPGRLAALTARLGGQRLVVTDHGLTGGDWAGLLPRLFDRFLTVSASSARILDAPPGRTRVIYGGADPARFFPDPRVRRHGALFVGRITPHKGVDVLVRALPAGAHLGIAGTEGHDHDLPERDYPAHLRALAAGRDVRFWGPVGDDDLALLCRRAAVLVLPSVHRTCYGRDILISELLGLVVLEAMASGTPVIASRLGGLPEIVQHGVTGFLVEPGNVAELRDCLAELLADRDLAGRMGRNALELSRACFTWRACADRCLAAYAELRAKSS